MTQRTLPPSRSREPQARGTPEIVRSVLGIGLDALLLVDDNPVDTGSGVVRALFWLVDVLGASARSDGLPRPCSPRCGALTGRGWRPKTAIGPRWSPQMSFAIHSSTWPGSLGEFLFSDLRMVAQRRRG